MQAKDDPNRTIDPLSHPTAAEWMAFLYKEVAAPRRREMGRHLGECPDCARQVTTWKAGLHDLDEWVMPISGRGQRASFPVLRWAVAASLVFGMGIWLGRSTSPGAQQVAELKMSVAQLSEAVHHSNGAELSAVAATEAANAETLRLLAQYSTVQDNQRAADQLALKDVLDGIDVRLATLRRELETVAVNTEGGFQATRQNLAKLVSFSDTK